MAERSGPLPLGFGDDGAEAAGGPAGRAQGGGARAAGAPGGTAPAFEAAMAELERIVRDLESGDLGLDAALGLYERGVALIRLCAGQLDRAEARLQALTIDETGRLALAPVEEPGA